MEIGLIGSGRMAQAMGGYLRDCGYAVRGLWGRNPQKAREAARYLEIEQVEDLADLIFRMDILLLAVSDDAIQSVGNEATLCGVELEGKWIGHFSGSLSLDVLEPLTRKGALGFSLHPLQTIPEANRGRKDLTQATFMLEAEEGFRDSLKAWLVLCGNPTAWIAPGKKGLYHLGACLASNYVMTLYRLAEEALLDSGVPETAASKALFPLMESTLKNYQSIGALAGLTGPVSRGDAGTVRKHLESLHARGWEHREPLIRNLGLEALDIAQKSGKLDAEKTLTIRQILNGGLQP